MIKKLFLSVFAIALFLNLSFAQAPGAAQKAQGKVNSIYAYIDSKITDVAKKLNANEKKAILKAYTDFELSQDSLKVRQENMMKGKQKMDALVAEVNAQSTALEQKGGQTVASQEEADKIKAEIEKEKADIDVKKAKISEMQEALKKEIEAIKAERAQLEPRRDEAVKKSLPTDKAGFFEQYRAQQKAKKS
jgi:predicted  nucleic acid-binding Zn-ribbon protein